jgi:hypothetical protein
MNLAKLKKKIKEIIKEQISSDYLHTWSSCDSKDMPGFQSQMWNGQTKTFNQNPHPVYGGVGYQADLIPGLQATDDTSDYSNFMNGGSFTIEALINNNHVIYNTWQNPSSGQVIKMQTCPPTAPHCTLKCMKYEGTVSAKALYNNKIPGIPNTINSTDFSFYPIPPIYTWQGAANLGIAGMEPGVLGTYDSCDECIGYEPEYRGYNCRSGIEGSSCEPCNEGDCEFDSFEECELSRKKNGGCEGTLHTFPQQGLTSLSKDKMVDPVKDKMVDPVKARMQKLAGIKEQEEIEPIGGPTTSPNEFAYYDFKSWAYEFGTKELFREKKFKVGEIEYTLEEATEMGAGIMFSVLTQIWTLWTEETDNDQFGRIKDENVNDFGKALYNMMKKDGKGFFFKGDERGAKIGDDAEYLKQTYGVEMNENIKHSTKYKSYERRMKNKKTIIKLLENVTKKRN